MHTLFRRHDQMVKKQFLSTLFTLGIVCLISVIVGLTSYLYSRQSEENESGRLLANLKDKADVLTWALEGSARIMGTRTFTHPPQLSAGLLEEIANQPGIVSICLVDRNGKVLLHSDPENTAPHLLEGLRKTMPDSSQLDALTRKTAITRFVTVGDESVYEVIKPFTPNILHHMGRHRRMLLQHERGPQQLDMAPLYMLISFDAGPYQKQMDELHRKNNMFSILATVVTGSLAALVLVLYNYFRSHRLLNDARSLASQIVTNLPIGIITADKNGAITLFNSQALRLLSLEKSVIPHSITQLPHLHWTEIKKRLDEHEKPILEEEAEIPLGEAGTLAISLSAAKVVNSDGSESGYLCILRDLQTVKNLQQQIRLNERLSALGNMAAGVAHEIRNPLSTLKGYATYVSEKLKNDPNAYATGKLMIEEVERLNRVVTDLLNVARPGQLQLEAIDLSDITSKAVQLVSFDASVKQVSIEFDPEKSHFMVSGDADRLIQVMLNILLNSVQAIEDSSGGSITITISKEENAGRSVQQRDSHQFVIIRIRDTGKGMDKEALANIFTPYYTTKASGSGLGLTITHQIVDQHNGTISVASNIGEGTVFSIRLPLITTQPAGR